MTSEEVLVKLEEYERRIASLESWCENARLRLQWYTADDE